MHRVSKDALPSSEKGGRFWKARGVRRLSMSETCSLEFSRPLAMQTIASVRINQCGSTKTG